MKRSELPAERRARLQAALRSAKIPSHVADRDSYAICRRLFELMEAGLSYDEAMPMARVLPHDREVQEALAAFVVAGIPFEDAKNMARSPSARPVMLRALYDHTTAAEAPTAC